MLKFKCLLGLVIVSVLCGCGGASVDTTNATTSTVVPTQSVEPAPTSTIVPTETPEAELTAESLSTLLKEQECYVSDTNYVVQSDEYKSLYPDLLSATVVNNSKNDIKDIVVGFVAWDSNGLPVKVLHQFDFMGGDSYSTECNFEDVNLVPGATYGADGGLPLAEECNTIKAFRACVLSYTTFEGETWENPYYDAWEKMYAGTKQQVN